MGGYSHLTEKGYPHATIDHAQRQYVVGAVHTNTIEGFWSIIKRGSAHSIM
jgi:transposase